METHARAPWLGVAFAAQDCKRATSAYGRADIDRVRFQYEFERRKYAQDLIDFDKHFSALFSSKPRTDDFQDGVTHEQFLK